MAYTPLINNARGQFRGIIANAFPIGLDRKTVRFLLQPAEGKPRLYQLFEERIAPVLEAELRQTTFQGPFGIDAFAYRDPSSALRLKPIVELNPRVTMGRIAREISLRIATSSVGLFEIVSRSRLRKRGAGDFLDYSRSIGEAHPIVREDSAKQRILSGSFPLTDPNHARRFLAVFHARDRYSELPL